jgi:hypothetical protein
VTVVGVEVWNSGSAAVDTYQTKTGATHTLALNGYLPMTNSYDAGKNEYFIIDQNGIIRFHDSLGTSVWTWMVDTLINRMTATIDRLLASGRIDRAPGTAGNSIGFYWSGEGDLVLNLTRPGRFSLELYDVQGRCLGILPEKTWPEGSHRLAVSRMARDPGRVASGTCFAVLKGPAFLNAIKVPFR